MVRQSGYGKLILFVAQSMVTSARAWCLPATTAGRRQREKSSAMVRQAAPVGASRGAEGDPPAGPRRKQTLAIAVVRRSEAGKRRQLFTYHVGVKPGRPVSRNFTIKALHLILEAGKPVGSLLEDLEILDHRPGLFD